MKEGRPSTKVFAWVAFAMLTWFSCGSRRPPATTDTTPARPAVAPSADAGDASTALPALGGHAWMEPLDLGPGHRAVVTVPLGATEPRPIMVGVHGAGDRAEWACGGYRIATKVFPFIVCPQGLSAGGGKFSTAGADRLSADIDRAVALVREQFGPYVAPGPLLYAGFSLGAMHGVSVVANHGETYPRVLLIEGAYREWTPALARAFAKSGGQRVMLVCQASDCRSMFRQAQQDLERAGVEVRLVPAANGRHNLDEAMMSALERALPWLVERDARWDGAWR
jgi:predicted esterase